MYMYAMTRKTEAQRHGRRLPTLRLGVLRTELQKCGMGDRLAGEDMKKEKSPSNKCTWEKKKTRSASRRPHYGSRAGVVPPAVPFPSPCVGATISVTTGHPRKHHGNDLLGMHCGRGSAYRATIGLTIKPEEAIQPAYKLSPILVNSRHGVPKSFTKQKVLLLDMHAVLNSGLCYKAKYANIKK